MTTCEGKVAYASEFLASNAATLHTFVHPACTDVRAYPCPESVWGGGERHWHIGHKHRERGELCKTEPPLRPRPHPPSRTHNPTPKSTSSRSQGAA